MHHDAHDLVLAGGHLIDPRHGIDGVRDVAVRDGRVVAVAEDLSADAATRRVDVSGLIVTPGLIDIHAHVFAGTGERGSYAGDNSVYPDDHCIRSGVTTAVDAGSSGHANFEVFKDRIIDRARTRVLALLNIVGNGMRGGPWEQDVSDMRVEPTVAMAQRYPETIVGVKTAHFKGPEWAPVDRAVAAATEAGGIVMVDFGWFHEARPFAELVTEHLRPDDIYTHAYLDRVPWFDAEGRVQPFFHEARERGVKFDVGHGGGSFWWDKAIPATRQGFWPDSLSTDLHIQAMVGGMKDMLNVMSKFLNLGAPLFDVIRWSTDNPARQIGRPELGHLGVGAPADITVLSRHPGRYGFLDVAGARMDGTERLECELTIREGSILWDLNGVAGRDWEEHYSR